MVERCVRSVKSQCVDYRDAMVDFSHNAKRFLVSGFLQGLGTGILATVFAIYIKTAGLPERVVGGAEASVAISAAVVALLGAPLIARLGYRWMMIAAIVLMVGSRLGMSFLPVAGAFVGFSLVVGLGDGFLRAIGAAFMSENSNGKERSHLFSVEFLVRVSAGLLGGLAGGFIPTVLGRLMPELTAYQWTMAAGALILGAGTLPMLTLRDRETPKQTTVEAYRASWAALRDWRPLAKRVLPQCAISLGGGLVIPFVPLYLKQSLGANIGQIGAVMGFSSLITALGVFGIPVIARKLGLAKGVALAQLSSVPFLAAVSLAGSLPTAIAALWIRGAMMNMAGPMYNQLVLEDVPDEQKPVISGWMFFALNLMWFAGNIAGGRLMETSYTLPYVFAVGLYAFGAAATYLAWREKPAAAPALGAAVSEAEAA